MAVAIINMIDINIISLSILCFIIIKTWRRAEQAYPQHRLFLALTLAVMLLTIADTLSWLADGRPGDFFYYLNWASTILLYLLIPVIPSIYLLYVDFQAYRDGKRLKRLAWPLAAYVIVDATFTMANVLTGWMFTIDGQNVYHRGPYLVLNPIACYIVFLAAFLFVLKNRKQYDEKHFGALLLFALPPMVGGALQGFIDGRAVVWAGMTLSVLLLYFSIQDKRLDTDYLTGTSNRRLLDSYIKDRIKNCSRTKSFSVMLIDLDGFKAINDTHGHITGDQALLHCVALLNGCLREGDFIARYGGDEFLIVLDIDRAEVLNDAVCRIKSCFGDFNRHSGLPYRLSFSHGCDIYDPLSGMTAEDFLRHVDRLMYEDKWRAGASELPPAVEPHGKAVGSHQHSQQKSRNTACQKPTGLGGENFT